MGAHQDEIPLVQVKQSSWRLILFVIAAFSAFILSITAFTHANYVKELNTIIGEHRLHLDDRAVLERRGLLDSLGNLLGQGVNATESALGSLLPNSTDILSSLLSSLGGANGSGIATAFAEPAKFLGVGLASGAMGAMDMPVTPTPQPTGVSLVAENLGSGLSGTIFNSSAVSSLIKSTSLSGGSSGTIGQAVLALAQGLGGGTASGLKLNTATTAPFNTSGVNGIAGNFGQGLSSSLFSAIQLPSLSSLTSSLTKRASDPLSNITSMIPQIASGLGTGIGQGAAVGLGFQNDTGASAGSSISGITQDFAKGLVSSFLENGTVTNIASSLNKSASGIVSGLSLSSISVAKAAEGLAVGLVSGVGSTISSLQVISANTSSFNDTVGGAATAFGQGLGSEGAKLVQQVLADKTGISAKSKRSLDDSAELVKYDRETSVALRKRATTATTNATDIAGVLASLNASAINPLVQTGVDSLTCQGVGGLAGVFLGLVNSKTIQLNGLLTSTKNLTLPDQVFKVTSDGNTYSVNPAKGLLTATINNTPVIEYVIVAALHIIFAIIAYFIAVPLLLLAYSSQKITNLVNRPVNGTPQPSKWQFYLGYSIPPLAVLTFAFGIAFRGGAAHFTSPHEIFGLLIFLQTIVAGVTTQLLHPNIISPKAQAIRNPNPKLALAHKANIGLLLLLSMITLLTGFTDLSAVSLCITSTALGGFGPSVFAALGWLILTPTVLAAGMEGLKWWIGKRGGAFGMRKGSLDNSVMIMGEKKMAVSYMDV